MTISTRFFSLPTLPFPLPSFLSPPLFLPPLPLSFLIYFDPNQTAMFALVQFYSVSRLDIAQYKPIPKFLSVKFVIFLSFWYVFLIILNLFPLYSQLYSTLSYLMLSCRQSIVVSGFVAIHGLRETTYWSSDNIATGIQVYTSPLLLLSLLPPSPFSSNPSYRMHYCALKC